MGFCDDFDDFVIVDFLNVDDTAPFPSGIPA